MATSAEDRRMSLNEFQLYVGRMGGSLRLFEAMGSLCIEPLMAKKPISSRMVLFELDSPRLVDLRCPYCGVGWCAVTVGIVLPR